MHFDVEYTWKWYSNEKTLNFAREKNETGFSSKMTKIVKIGVKFNRAPISKGSIRMNLIILAENGKQNTFR